MQLGARRSSRFLSRSETADRHELDAGMGRVFQAQQHRIYALERRRRSKSSRSRHHVVCPSTSIRRLHARSGLRQYIGGYKRAGPERDPGPNTRPDALCGRTCCHCCASTPAARVEARCVGHRERCQESVANTAAIPDIRVASARTNAAPVALTVRLCLPHLINGRYVDLRSLYIRKLPLRLHSQRIPRCSKSRLRLSYLRGCDHLRCGTFRDAVHSPCYSS